jgi:serine/threonine-protein kinase
VERHVFAAENVDTGRQVAIKIPLRYREDRVLDPSRFGDEIRAHSAIDSEHVVKVVDVAKDPTHGALLVFELLDGETLRQRVVREGPLTLAQLHPIVDQVWRGLGDVHRVGIVHRDIKPSNVFLERLGDGSTRAKILDFGSCKLPAAMGGDTLTQLGQSLGTFQYMPPEQIGKAKTVDQRADIYACTTMIYQMLTGRLPYPAQNLLLLVDFKCKTDARTLGEVTGGPVDPRLEAFVARGLARDPGKRFQTASEALFAWRELQPPSSPG